jgi:hypothetical protein
MSVEFSKKFGLEGDRKKLVAGDGPFSITRIEMKESKKDYPIKEGKSGKITLAHFDALAEDGKTLLKFYSPNGPIIQACKDMLAEIGTKDKLGTLKESVHIQEVAEAGEKGREYLYFK